MWIMWASRVFPKRITEKNTFINLKLLIEESRRIIKTLEEQLPMKKELLRKNSSKECFNYYNDKLSSMSPSLEILLFNRRLR